jgi:hypothetical protein
MDCLTFITKLLETLAWPTVVIVIFLLLRKPVAAVSFRQACMTRFERCGIVGCQHTIQWRTVYGYQKGARRSCAAGGRSTAVRALA